VIEFIFRIFIINTMTTTLEHDATFSPEAFIEDSYRIEQSDLSSIRCIDDREERNTTSEDPLPDYAIPGGGLGIAMDVMTAMYDLADGHALPGPDINTLFSTIEKALGGSITYHTDTIHDSDLACAGCGYCGGACEHPEDNFLPEKVAEFVKAEGMKRCTETLKKNNIPIPKYEGPHVAKAVMIVRGDDIGLPSTSSSGEHAYVYHVDVRDELLKKVAEATLPLARKAVPAGALKADTWLRLITAAADKHLGAALEKLAKGLPQYIVSEEDEAVVVEKRS
jgi:hypothetical protein